MPYPRLNRLSNTAFSLIIFLFCSVLPTLATAATTTGPNSPGTVVDDATVGTIAWTSPSSAEASDGVFASAEATCFVAGTLIETPNGDMPIEDIQIGQEVYGFDADQKLVKAKVSAVESLQTDQLVILMTDSGFVITTSDHPFYVGDGKFQVVRDLQVGSAVYDSAFSGHRILLKTPIRVRHIPVYNLTVDGVHDFFANGFAVHNKP